MSESGQPIKVLYCESCMDGTVGGSHHCLLRLIEGLDRSASYEPTVIFYDRHALLSRFQSVAETLVRPQSADAPVRWGAARGGVYLPLVLLRRFVNFLKFLGAIAEHAMFLKRHQFRLMHLNNSITRHHEWMCAAFLAGVPFVVSERGINARYTMLDRALAQRAALIIPVSRWVMNHMVQRGVPPGNMRVLYDGITPSTITPARPPEAILRAYGVQQNQPIVGIVGNVREWKGQEIVVRALIEVAKIIPDMVCFIVGAATHEDKPYLDRLHALVKTAGIESNVRFTGYQPDPASFINIMRVVLHGSIQPEPFGMVILEAMAQRKPVIGSRAGGPVEMIREGETGYTYPPGDAAALATYIIELAKDPEKARQMGESGYKRLMESFTLHGFIHDIHSLYRTVLSKQSLPIDIGIAFTKDQHATS